MNKALPTSNPEIEASDKKSQSEALTHSKGIRIAKDEGTPEERK